MFFGHVLIYFSLGDVSGAEKEYLYIQIFLANIQLFFANIQIILANIQIFLENIQIFLANIGLPEAVSV